MNRAHKPRVLCVDDEPHVLESLRDSLRRHFEIVATTNGFHALKLLTDEPCDVVLSDMRMPLLNGARFLTLAREHAPETVRVMLTGHSTLTDAVAAVNEGEIYRLLLKPCATDALIATLDEAVARHAELVRGRDLVDASTRATIRALLAVAGQVDPSGPGRARRVRQHAVDLATAAEGVAPSPELERACELLQLGAVALAPDVRAKVASATRLSREHAQELERLPELALPFVRDVPTLEPVVALLEAAMRPFVAPRAGVAGTPPSAAVLRIAFDYELLERQGAPMETALSTMQARRGRYSLALLDRFAQLLRFG